MKISKKFLHLLDVALQQDLSYVKIHHLLLIAICFPQLKYKEDYNKNVKGQWCETPYFDVATARVAMENLSDVRP